MTASVHTRATNDRRRQIVTEGAQPRPLTFGTLDEARAAGRARAKRLGCVHIVHDVDGAPIGATLFGGSRAVVA